MENTIKLLIADDDDINNFIINRLILKTPFRVAVKDFSNGADTLPYITANISSPDLPNIAFIDINMPGISGWELLDELKAMPQTPLRLMHTYMLSSSVVETDMLKAQSYQYVKGFISKPINVDMLTKILHQYMASLN